MIENQGAWADILYGKDSDYAIVNNWAYRSGMNNSGCGVIAVINALNSLGGNLSGEEVAQMIRDFETNGITMDGAIGTSPMAIYDYMRDRGYDASGNHVPVTVNKL